MRVECVCVWVDPETKRKINMCGAHVQAARDLMQGTIDGLKEQLKESSEIKGRFSQLNSEVDYYQRLSEVQQDMIGLLFERIKDLS